MDYEELLVALRKVIRAIDLHSKQLNKQSGLTTPQLMVLRHVCANAGVMVREVADHVNLSPATVTSILDRLEVKQLVTRQRSTQDRRKVGLHITEAGQAVLSNVPKPLQDHFISRFESLEDWEQSLLISSMQRIATMMNAEDLDAAPLLEVGQIQIPDTEK